MQADKFDSFLNQACILCSEDAERRTNIIQDTTLILPVEYLYILKQEALQKIYSRVSALSRRMREGNITPVKTALEKEIVRRYLTAYPKRFDLLKKFLNENGFGKDPLTKNIDRLSRVYTTNGTWFSQEEAFLDVLQTIKEKETFFYEVIDRILLLFSSTRHMVNLLMVVDKSSLKRDVACLIEDALVRRIGTEGQFTQQRVFSDDVSEDFEDTAITAQDGLKSY